MATRIHKFIRNNQVATSASPISTTQPSPSQTLQGWVLGDLVYNRLMIRMSGNLNLTTSSAGTTITRGGLQCLRAVLLQTYAHGNVIDNVDGILLHEMQYLKGPGVRPVNTDIAANTTGTPVFDYALEFPFLDPFSARPEDTGLQMTRVNAVLLQNTWGIVTDFISGGTYSTETIQVLNEEIHLDYTPGPINVNTDGPIFMPYLGVLKVPITQTTKQFQIFLPYSDRVYRRLFVTQRNGSTLAELANTIVGANDQDRFSLKLNSFAYYDNIEWLALQDQDAYQYNPVSGLPTGIAVVDFFIKRHDGARYSDALSVVSPVPGVIELDIDVTSVSNGQIWLGFDCAKPIPAAAFVAPPAPTAASR